MIFDAIKNFEMYLSVHPKFHLVKDFLNENDLKNLEVGRYELGENCFANVDKYQTKNIDNCFIEAHKKYIDIQIVIMGNEKFGYCNIDNCIEKEIIVEKDLVKLDGNPNFIELKEDSFIILFPHDAHMPQIKADNDSEMVKKIVFKIPVLKNK